LRSLGIGGFLVLPDPPISEVFLIFLAKRLGRFTGILLFLVACLIVAAWLQILDYAPFVFLALAPLAILVFCASFALLAGVLFVRTPRHKRIELTRMDAPALWAIWDELAPPRGERRSLLVDDLLNASISERKRWFDLLGRHTTLTLGLELLMLVDERLLRTVIAHEVGHAKLQHTAGATNLAEFLETFETLFVYVDPETTVAGGLADWALATWLKGANLELMRVSRKNELEADSFSARLCGVDAVADAEVFIATVSRAVKTEIHEPLETELLHAIRAPVAPHQRVWERRAELISAACQEKYLSDVWQETTKKEASHPCFRERFENIVPGIAPRAVAVGASAAEICLPQETFRRVMDKTLQTWTDFAENAVGIY